MKISFLHYDSRSGSTFLAKKLTENYGVFSPPEVNFIPKLCEAYRNADASKWVKIIKKDPKSRDWKLSDKDLEKLKYKRFDNFETLLFFLLKGFREEAEGRAVLIKKNYLKDIDEIDEVLPKANHLFLIRDGRAVLASKKKSIQSGTGKPFTKSVYRASRQWKKFIFLSNEAKKIVNDRGFFIYYEDILRDKLSFDHLANYIGATDKTSKYHLPKRYDYGLHKNIDGTVDFARLDAWKIDLNEKEISTYEKYTKTEMKYLGYQFKNEGHASFFFRFKDFLRFVYELLYYRPWSKR